MWQFVPNFLSYVSAKYYLNWFTVRKIITKIKRVNFLLRHSVLLLLLLLRLTCISGCSTFTLTAALRWSWAGVAVCPVMGWVLRCSAAAILCNRFSCFTSSGATPGHRAHDNNISNFISCNRQQITKNQQSGLLMRPEHSETKAKTETRECKTETKKLLWHRDQKLRDRDWDQDQSSKVNWCESNTNRYVLFCITHMRWIINPKWILHLKWSVSKTFNYNS